MNNIEVGSDSFAIKYYENNQSGSAYRTPAEKWNRHYEFIFSLTGEVNLNVNNDSYRMPTQSFALIKPYSLHECSFVGKRNELYIIRVKYNALPLNLIEKLKSMGTVQSIRYTPIKDELPHLRQDMLVTDTGCRLFYSEIRASNIIISIANLFDDMSLTEINPVSSNKFLGTLIDFTREHIQDIDTTDTLCSKLSVKANTMNAIFHNRFGISIRDFMDIVRITKADEFEKCGFLKTAAWKKAGFSSYSAYRRCRCRMGLKIKLV